MNFLRALFWIVVTMIVAIFSVRNWAPVTINLFGGLQADVKLPVLLLIFFLLGLVPTWIYHRAWRWRDTRRRLAVERPLATPAPVAAEPPAGAF